MPPRTAEAPVATEAAWPALARVAALVERLAGDDRPVVAERAALPDSAGDARVRWLADAFGLDDLDLDLLLLAAAPDLDPRIAAVIAALQGDPSRRRPTVELALTLLCADADEAVTVRGRLAADALLVREQLVHVVAPPWTLECTLLEHRLHADPQTVALICGESGLDPRLCGWCVAEAPAREEPAPDPALVEAALGAHALRAPLRLHLRGSEGGARRRLPRELAGALDAMLLAADLARAPEDLDVAMRVLLREAWLRDAVLLLAGIEALSPPRRRDVLGALAGSRGVVITEGERSLGGASAGDEPLGSVEIVLRGPGASQRRRRWRRELAELGIAVADEDVDALAGRFRLDEDEIAEAAVRAFRTAWVAGRRPGRDDLVAAARGSRAHDLGSVARPLDAGGHWRDLVAPPEVHAQLRELAARVALAARVREDWGFGARFAPPGVTALFAGPSGTGKTMAARILAAELGLELFRIDLATVVSKYIGETEKNLERVFAAAAGANAILLFDEADALFGRRSEVRDAHDRYANVEVAYLLQRMEEHDGLTILATNLAENIDQAFARRLDLAIGFPFPDVEERRRIWEQVWPAEAPLADDLDLDLPAERLVLSGGNIRNIALAAAFLAAADGGPVATAHLWAAARREHDKLGREPLSAALDGPGTRVGAA